jgi:chromate transporter
MVAYIRRMAVERTRWLDGPSFADGVALCQMIPGATAMQTAAYVGLRVGGVAGALASFVGFGLPAFALIMTLSVLYERSHGLPTVISSFNVLQAVVVAIIANAALSFGQTSLRTWKDGTIAAVAAILFGLSVHPVAVIATAALLGLALNEGRTAVTPQVDPPQGGRSTRSLVALLAATGGFFFLLLLADRALFDLAALMFRIDLFAFGGGFASVPLMLHEFVTVRGWMAGATFLNGIALGQVTPGPIVITATFVGYITHGLAGSLVATVGVFAPSFLIVVGILPHFDRLRASPHFNRAITGILASFVGLLLTVVVRFALQVQWDAAHVLLGVGALAALLVGIDILWVVLVGIMLAVGLALI